MKLRFELDSASYNSFDFEGVDDVMPLATQGIICILISIIWAAVAWFADGGKIKRGILFAPALFVIGCYLMFAA